MLSINPSYLILNILTLLTLILTLKKYKIEKKYQIAFIVIYLLISILTYNYINGIIKNIFALKYLSVKTYLVIVAIINSIILFTMNKKVKPVYKFLNYFLFILTMIIFGATIAVVLGNKYDSLYLMSISNAVNFIDLSMVLFLLYLIGINLTYIGYFLFENKDKLKEQQPLSFKLKVPNLKSRQRKKETPKLTKKTLMTKEELLNFKGDTLYIHGEDCNIIFEDSNAENIFLNYQILEEDIHAKMMNGYTLKENKMLKSICLKLQVNNLRSIDLSNVSILNKISVEEYLLLKEVFGMN